MCRLVLFPLRTERNAALNLNFGCTAVPPAYLQLGCRPDIGCLGCSASSGRWSPRLDPLMRFAHLHTYPARRVPALQVRAADRPNSIPGEGRLGHSHRCHQRLPPPVPTPRHVGVRCLPSTRRPVLCIHRAGLWTGGWLEWHGGSQQGWHSAQLKIRFIAKTWVFDGDHGGSSS